MRVDAAASSQLPLRDVVVVVVVVVVQDTEDLELELELSHIGLSCEKDPRHCSYLLRVSYGGM
jgi:hypothetical protein